MAEGFGPRFRRLREKVDAWGKEYDERRAADKAFLERDRARSEKARAEWKEHQARLRQRVKVYGRSGAKAEGKPSRGTGTGQTVTPVTPAPTAPANGPTQVKNPEATPTKTSTPKAERTYRFASESPNNEWEGIRESGNPTPANIPTSLTVAGVNSINAGRNAIKAGMARFGSAKVRGMEHVMDAVKTKAGQPIKTIWGKLNGPARNALMPKIQAHMAEVTKVARKRGLKAGAKAFLGTAGRKMLGFGVGTLAELAHADPISKQQDLAELARLGKVKLTPEQAAALAKNKEDVRRYFEQQKKNKRTIKRSKRYDDEDE